MSQNGDAGGRTQAERRAESEDALLAAAAELVSERGIERTSLAAIGEGAGLSRGLATHHFGSKRVLVERLAQRAQDHLLELMLESAQIYRETTPGASGLDLILMYVDVFLEQFEDPSPDVRALIVLWGATFPTDASVERIEEADRQSLSGWQHNVSVGQGDGSVRDDLAPEAIACLIHGMLRGVAGLMLTDNGIADLSTIRQTSADWIRAALVPRA